MRLLGAILAGGRSSRFGSDKAVAVWQGRTLLDWATGALAPHVEATVICGRDGGIADRPAGGLGPLAGINAALHLGAAAGFDAVLTLPCDTPTVEPALLDALCRAGVAALCRRHSGDRPLAVRSRRDARRASRRRGPLDAGLDAADRGAAGRGRRAARQRQFPEDLRALDEG